MAWADASAAACSRSTRWKHQPRRQPSATRSTGPCGTSGGVVQRESAYRSRVVRSSSPTLSVCWPRTQRATHFPCARARDGSAGRRSADDAGVADGIHGGRARLRGEAVETELHGADAAKRSATRVPTGEFVAVTSPPWDDHCFTDLHKATVPTWPGAATVTIESYGEIAHAWL